MSNIRQFLTFRSPFTLLRYAASGLVMKEDARKLSWKQSGDQTIMEVPHIGRACKQIKCGLWNIVVFSMVDLL